MASLEEEEEEEEEEELFIGEEILEEDIHEGGSVVFTGVKKHSISHAGTSDITSAARFKEKFGRERSQLRQLLSPPNYADDEELSGCLGISVEELKEVKERCDEEGSLQCVAVPRRHLTYKLRSFTIYYCNIACHTKRKATFSSGGEEENPAHEEEVPVPEGEAILSVDLYSPHKQAKDQNFMVLGSQELTELRDNIICYSDYFCSEELSESPDAFKEEKIKEPPNISKSAYFFICNTFYDDMRHPEASRTSRKVIEWTEEGSRLETSFELDHFSTATMEGTTFNQLHLRLGFPYLYCHHGNCEHLLIFRDMRIFCAKIDPPLVADYPKLVYSAPVRIEACHSCGIHSVWVTYDDELAPESPCFYCHRCFVNLHYTADNKKVCSFKAYRYSVPTHKCFMY